VRSTRPGRPGYAVVRRMLRGQRRVLTRTLAWSVVESLPVVVSGLAVSAAIDRFLAGRIAAGLGFLALLVVAAGIGALATRRLFPLLATLVEGMRDDLVTAVVGGALASTTGSFDRPDAAGVARLTEQVQMVRHMSFALLRSVRQTAFVFLGALVGLALLAPPIAFVTAAVLALTLGLSALALPGLAGRHRAVLLAEEEVARRGGTAFGGIRDAIACGGEDRAVEEVGTAVDEEASRSRSLASAAVARRLIVFAGGQLPLVLLLAAAPLLLRQRRLTFGEVVGAATYLTASLEPALRNLAEVVWGWGLDLIVHLERLGEGFGGRSDLAAASPTASPQRGYDLAVRGLSFSYGPEAEPVVRDLDLIVGEGDHLAVVGPSGIGKSTLANLLAGLLRPQRGAVLLGGVTLDELGEAHLRATVGLIPQEAYVFTGTLRENLAYLAPRATEADVVEAASDVGLSSLIDRLGGLDAALGVGGAELSNGEKQLIALARVYLSQARMVILDEATSNLDPQAEAFAEAAFARRPGTLIVIAHRISSARRAKRILLLDGSSVHLGTHDQLVATSDLYADLVGQWDERGPGQRTTRARSLLRAGAASAFRV
jgi:ABC-type multidrug transport system fused ATPase/permease subunit